MKIFALYTAARAGLFLACWAVIWLVIGWWVEWDSVNALSTALVALIASSVIALAKLTGLRARFAADVAARAERATAAFNARRTLEDVAADQSEPPASAPTRSVGGADREPDEQA